MKKQKIITFFATMKRLNYFSTIVKKDAEIIMIRHAESLFNYVCKIRAKQLGISHLNWFEQDQHQEFSQTASFNPQLLDCTITQKGREQCQKASKLVQKKSIDLILVSPKMRALETCDLVFKGRNIRIEVQPILSQACRYACDVVRGQEYKQKIRKFPNFSFQHDLSSSYVYNINQNQIDNFEKECQQNKISTKKQKQMYLMKMIQQQKVYQSDEQLRQRAWKVKMMLKQRAEKDELNTICIVSHWYLLTYICSRKFSANSENLEYDEFKNCSPVSKKISQLIEVK